MEREVLLLRRLIKRLGVVKSILFLSLALVLVVALTATILMKFSLNSISYYPLWVCVGTAIITAPVILYYFVNLIYRLDASEEKLRELSIRDDLTDAFNRRYFLEQAEKEFAKADRYDQLFSIVALDIDNFKQINDAYGHFAGDAVLKEMAHACNNTLRASDIFARFGGEEFMFLISESDKGEVKHFAERVRSMLENLPIHYKGIDIRFTVSLGVKTFDAESKSLSTMLAMADAALYEAKRRGKNCVVVAGRT